MAEEAQEIEQEENPLHDLVQHALAQDYNKASQAFGDAMTVKLNDVMDQEQIKLANQFYNNAEDEEDLADEQDVADEDDETPDDLEDDSEEDSEEGDLKDETDESEEDIEAHDG